MTFFGDVWKLNGGELFFHQIGAHSRQGVNSIVLVLTTGWSVHVWDACIGVHRYIFVHPCGLNLLFPCVPVIQHNAFILFF